MNYFDFYGIPIQFNVDVSLVKQLYLRKSRETHPDFFTLASAKEQEQSMHQASINNEAYRTLSDTDKRVHYILSHFNIIGEREKNELSPHFLMEMMDINEQLVDAALDGELRLIVAEKVSEQLDDINHQQQPLMASFDESQDVDILKKIKDFYFQRKYLLRIKEKLDTFATP